MKKLLAITTLLLTACGAGFINVGNNINMNPQDVSVTLSSETLNTMTYTATCEVPQNVWGGPVETCEWSVQVNGVVLTPALANGFTTQFTVARPAPSQTNTIRVAVKSVRRNLKSLEFVKTIVYTEPDVAPPAPTNIDFTYATVGDSLEVTLVGYAPTNQSIETLAWTVTRAGTPNTTISVANGLTTKFRVAKLQPAQTITLNVSVVAVRRGLTSTTYTENSAYTETDVAPPAPTNIIISIVP